MEGTLIFFDALYYTVYLIQCSLLQLQAALSSLINTATKVPLNPRQQQLNLKYMENMCSTTKLCIAIIFTY